MTPNISTFCGVALVVIFPMAVVSCRLDTPSESYYSSGLVCFTCQRSRRSVGSGGSKSVARSIRLRRGRRILTWRSNVVERRGRIPSDAEVEFLETPRSNFSRRQGRISSDAGVEFVRAPGSNFFSDQGRISSYAGVEFLQMPRSNFFGRRGRISSDAGVELLR
jgi:hypothetical protein